MLGGYVDAVGANAFTDGNVGTPAGAAITIGDTTFNPLFSDQGIVLSSATGVNGGTNGSGSFATPYQAVLDDVAYVGGFNSTLETGTVTLNSLKVGDLYQVQVFNDGGSVTTISGLNSDTIAQQYTIGTFTATGLGPTTSESFTFSTTNGNGVGELSDFPSRSLRTRAFHVCDDAERPDAPRLLRASQADRLNGLAPINPCSLRLSGILDSEAALKPSQGLS
jgi:hypothetical protein